jgi:hypothetical protein
MSCIAHPLGLFHNKPWLHDGGLSLAAQRGSLARGVFT